MPAAELQLKSKSKNKNNNMEGTVPMIMEGTRPLRGQPYPTL